jgi:hypothetical protein
MEVSGQLHVPGNLSLERKPDSHRMKGYFTPTVGLDVSDLVPIGIRINCPPARSLVALPTLPLRVTESKRAMVHSHLIHERLAVSFQLALLVF